MRQSQSDLKIQRIFNLFKPSGSEFVLGMLYVLPKARQQKGFQRVKATCLYGKLVGFADCPLQIRNL